SQDLPRPNRKAGVAERPEGAVALRESVDGEEGKRPGGGRTVSARCRSRRNHVREFSWGTRSEAMSAKSRSLCDGKCQAEFRPSGRRLGTHERPAVRLGNATRDGEPQARAVSLAIRLLRARRRIVTEPDESFEDAVAITQRDSHPLVDDADVDRRVAS